MADLETLLQAAKDGDAGQVRALIARHPQLVSARLPSGESPLMAALYRGHATVVAALVELGVELDVFAAAAISHLSALQDTLKPPGAVSGYAYDGWTPLHLAAFFGQLEAARILLDAGADFGAVSRNSMKNTPLHAAAAGKHEAIAVLLIDRGADAEIVDAGGYTPAAIAAENGLAAVLRALARSG